MTVNYNLYVSTSSPCAIMKILCRWRGSIWKAVLLDALVWLLLYVGLATVYRYALAEPVQVIFYKTATQLNEKLSYIPLSFMLGFFVTNVFTRWTLLFNNIGLIEPVALMVSTYLNGNEENDRIRRRNIIRYCVLGQVMTFRDISIQVRHRLPTIDTVVAAGFMLPHEREIYESGSNLNKCWLPFAWAKRIVREFRNEEKIPSDVIMDRIIDPIRNFRNSMAILTNYDWVPIPIMYPQLVFLASYSYFLLALIARQENFECSQYDTEIYITPIMTVLEFIFFMGWVKVAEAMLNPFGEDDDDFECNYLLDRNLAIGMAIADECYNDVPSQQKDVFWDEPTEPLYSEQSVSRPNNPLLGSASCIELPESVEEVTMISSPMETSNLGKFSSKKVSVSRNNTAKSLVRRRNTRPATDCHVVDEETEPPTITLPNNIMKETSID